jgi:hypothetical protein
VIITKETAAAVAAAARKKRAEITIVTSFRFGWQLCHPNLLEKIFFFSSSSFE